MSSAPKRWGTALFLAIAAMGWSYAAGTQMVFRTPEEAGNALLAAIESADSPRFLAIAGSRMAPLLSSGDEERDLFDRARLVDAAHRGGIRIASRGAGRLDLFVGDIRQAFPAPLVKTESGWRFDEEAGAREIAARRIYANEIAVMEECRRFREAQLAIFARRAGGEHSYAAQARSTPGNRDGLFWPDSSDGDESPLGPSFAGAFVETQPGVPPAPHFGYYFRILTAQGPQAPGGAADYRVNGQLRNGFALLAWPARYGAGGVRSFLINHEGELHYRDLGEDTARIAGSLNSYNPDGGWVRVETHDQ